MASFGVGNLRDALSIVLLIELTEALFIIKEYQIDFSGPKLLIAELLPRGWLNVRHELLYDQTFNAVPISDQTRVERVLLELGE